MFIKVNNYWSWRTMKCKTCTENRQNSSGYCQSQLRKTSVTQQMSQPKHAVLPWNRFSSLESFRDKAGGLRDVTFSIYEASGHGFKAVEPEPLQRLCLSSTRPSHDKPLVTLFLQKRIIREVIKGDTEIFKMQFHLQNIVSCIDNAQ